MNNYLESFVKAPITSRNFDDTVLKLPGLLASTILDHTLIRDNSDLKAFADRLGNTDYKDYLFKARPALYARIINDIYVKKVQTVSSMQEIQTVISDALEWGKAHPQKSSRKKLKADPKAQEKKLDSMKKLKKDDSKKESPLKQWQKIIKKGN